VTPPPPLHPDQREPDSQIGPWRVVASLGAGGFGRVFKVERGGRFYTLKMALRPAGRQPTEEEDVNGRLAHEVAALLACAPHPNLPRVHAVDRWPEPPAGYLYFVTDFIDGETFHEWRWRVKPTAAHLLSVFTEVVRVVADLHRRGMHHRDLKGDNLLIRREDERPILIDMGTVRMPGATTLTVGIAPASPHLLPPECVAFLREGAWKTGAYFDAGIPGDLYALGGLLYEALTDGYAFDPRLPYERLLPAIETVTPLAPHTINPKVPRALGEIALRLLAKRPEDRYSGTEALLQALWDVTKEKRQPEWKVSLDLPAEVELSPEAGTETPRMRVMPELRQAPLEPGSSIQPPGSEALSLTKSPEATLVGAPKAPAPLASELPAVAGKGTPSAEPPRSRRVSRRAAIGAGAFLVLGLVAFGMSRLGPSPGGATAPVPPPPAEKGSATMTNRSESPPDASTLAVVSPPVEDGGVTDAGLQASTAVQAPPGIGPSPKPKKRSSVAGAMGKALAVACTAAACASGRGTRMEPPEADCPPGSMEVMERLSSYPPRVTGGDDQLALVPDDFPEPIPVPPDGPITVYVRSDIDHRIPAGSRFYGQLFLGKDRVFGWVTELQLPNGERLPFCANIIQNEMGKPLGRRLLKSSTSEKPMMESGIFLITTKRLGKL
jgi:serine/threonine-protein kinase